MITPIKNYPAFLHKENNRKILIITDLHLGWETHLTRRGIHLPSQMPKIRKKLLQIINITNPNGLIILGDVKHTIAKAEQGEWRDIPEFFTDIEAKVSNIQIIRGNHDGNLEPLLLPTIEMHPSTGTTLNDVGLFHGHTWPAEKLLSCHTLIMGHVHPTVAFRDYLGLQTTSPVWIRVNLNTKKLKIKKRRNMKKTTKEKLDLEPKTEQLIIMPCFNDFLGGRPINRQSKHRSYIGPILRSDAVNIETAEAYLLDGTFLGRIKQLRALS
jgi:hypothetical protein